MAEASDSGAARASTTSPQKKGRFFRSPSPDPGQLSTEQADPAGKMIANGGEIAGPGKDHTDQDLEEPGEPPKKKGRFFKESSPDPVNGHPQEESEAAGDLEDDPMEDVKTSSPTAAGLFAKADSDDEAVEARIPAKIEKPLTKPVTVIDDDDDLVMLNTPPKPKPGASKANGKGKDKSKVVRSLVSTTHWKEKYLGSGFTSASQRPSPCSHDPSDAGFTCKGYMIYSARNLTEDEPFTLVRPEEPKTDPKGKKKAASSRKEDHVVRSGRPLPPLL